MTQPDMSQILAQAQEMQQQLQAAQQEILESEVVGDAGNGLVKVTMGGNGLVTDIAISPEIVDPEDIDTLQDLIIGAFQDAHNKVGELAEAKMGPLTQALDGPGGLF